MNFKIEKTNLDKVYKIYHECFRDDRGEINNLHSYHPENINYSQDKLTISKQHVLRGLHGDHLNDKLIFCLSGSFKLVVVNYDKNHNQYLKSEIFTMSEKDKFSIFVPKNYLNGHYCLEDSYFFYRWSHGYVEPSDQISTRWDSFNLKQLWNIDTDKMILSARDQNSMFVE